MNKRLLDVHSRSVTIKVDTTCPHCGRRVWNERNKFFACFPNNVVVHYSCLKDKHVCPVTGVNFLDLYNESIANGGDGVVEFPPIEDVNEDKAL